VEPPAAAHKYLMRRKLRDPAIPLTRAFPPGPLSGREAVGYSAQNSSQKVASRDVRVTGGGAETYPGSAGSVEKHALEASYPLRAQRVAAPATLRVCPQAYMLPL